MDDTASRELLSELAQLLTEHRAENTVILDIREQSTWTDYFIIGTISSHAHMKGVTRYVYKFLSEKRIQPLHKHKNIAEDGWNLIDCGDFVIHLMSRQAREFYDLERLWFAGKEVSYSSKSS